MTIILKQVYALIKLLNSDTGTVSIASGVALGFVLGMTPAFSLQTILVILIMLLFRVQIGAAMITAFFVAFPAYLLDPVFDFVGGFILTQEPLKPLFTLFYNMPIVPFTRFNDSIVMGSGVITLALMPFTFLLAKLMVEKYRAVVVARFEQSKFYRFYKMTRFYDWYEKYDKFFGRQA